MNTTVQVLSGVFGVGIIGAIIYLVYRAKRAEIRAMRAMKQARLAATEEALARIKHETEEAYAEASLRAQETMKDLRGAVERAEELRGSERREAFRQVMERANLRTDFLIRRAERERENSG